MLALNKDSFLVRRIDMINFKVLDDDSHIYNLNLELNLTDCKFIHEISC